MALLLAGCSGCTRKDPPAAVPPTTASATRAAASEATASASSATVPSGSGSPTAATAFDASETPAPYYPLERVHSPITPGTQRWLRTIAAKARGAQRWSFAKVGDSITYSDDSYRCFARPPTNLGEHAELATTLQRFASVEAGVSPFSRESQAAQIGWSAWQVLSGSPPPLQQELDAAHPRIAFVQFGTNDIEIGALHHFADQLWNIIDFLTDRGVVPILFTIPPRQDKAAAAVWVPRYNAVIRGIAQASRAPLVDYHRALLALPGQGLGKDGIHPTTYHGPRGRDGCDLSAEGLRHGYNLRNLLVLEALTRVDRALRGEAAPDSEAEVSAAPTHPPLVKVVRLEAGSGKVDDYACRESKPARGRELQIEFSLSSPAQVNVFGFDRVAETELYLLRASSATDCIRADPRRITTKLDAGRYFLAVDRLSTQQAVSDSIVIITTD